MPVLLVASAEDRLLPSLTEASRLRRLIPDARRVVSLKYSHGILQTHSGQTVHTSRLMTAHRPLQPRHHSHPASSAQPPCNDGRMIIGWCSSQTFAFKSPCLDVPCLRCCQTAGTWRYWRRASIWPPSWRARACSPPAPAVTRQRRGQDPRRAPQTGSSKLNSRLLEGSTSVRRMF